MVETSRTPNQHDPKRSRQASVDYCRPGRESRETPIQLTASMIEKGVVGRGLRWRDWVRDQFDADLTIFPNRVRARGREPCPGGVISRAAEPAAASEQRQPVLQRLPGPSPRGDVVATRQRGHEPLWHGG